MVIQNIKATKKIQLGHGVIGTFYRRDNDSIIVHIGDNMEVKHGEGTTQHVEKIPLGWRPSTEIHVECCLIIGETFQPSRHLEYVFYPDGSITSYSKGNMTVPIHVVGTATYMMHPNDIKEARNPKPVSKKQGTTLTKDQYSVNTENVTRYIDKLINGAVGKVEMVCISDDIASAKVVGRFRTGSKDVTGLHIGTIPTGGSPGTMVLYPIYASETVRNKDAFIQINNDGRIYIMEAESDTEYTFTLDLPAIY